MTAQSFSTKVVAGGVVMRATGERLRRESPRFGLPLWLRIARIYGQNLRMAGEQLRDFDLSPAQFDVLAQVGSTEGLCQLDLAHRLLVTQGNVTQILDRMEQRGFLERRRERRLNRLWLTPAGREIHDLVVPLQEELHCRQFQSLTQHEQRLLLSLLRKLERGRRLEARSDG